MAWVAALFLFIQLHRNASPELKGKESVGSQLARMPRALIVAAAIFVGITLGEVVLITMIKVAALKEIAPMLSGPIVSVSIDGTRMSDATALVGALRKMHEPLIGHHSHPTKRYQVVLDTPRGYLTLDLGRDSGDPHEYWVFYPGFHATTSNAIGHAITDAIDQYLGSRKRHDIVRSLRCGKRDPSRFG